jgi:hypothetical protein
MMILLVMMVGACSSTPDGALVITNSDPRAPSNQESVVLMPPEGWAVNSEGNGITDGQAVITAMTLSDLPTDNEAILADITGQTNEIDGQTVILQRTLNRLMAWRVVDGTILTLTMQSRTETPFTPQQEQTLVELAASAQF